MLSYMRKHSKSWMTKFIFGLIIIVFVFWGGSTYWAREANKVVKIDNYIISQQQFSKAYTDALQAYQERYGQAFNAELIKQLGIKERVLDQMIDNYLLEQEAARLGIVIDGAQMQQLIRDVPAFQREGQFDLESYRRVLEYNRLSPQEFENQQRRSLLRQRLFEMVTANVTLAPNELEASYREQNDTFDLNFIRVSAGYAGELPPPAEEEVVAYYDAHREQYKTAPLTTIDYLEFSVDDYREGGSVSTDEARQYYDGHTYTEPARVHARHILIRIPEDASGKALEEKRALANEILARARGGEDFAALAKRYSEDPGSARKGGDLGMMDKDSLVDGLGDRLFALDPGAVAGPFQTRFGLHVVRLVAKQAPRVQPFEEVEDAIVAKLETASAREGAAEEAQRVFMELYEYPGMDIVGYAEDRGMDLKQAGPFSEDEKVVISPALAKQAFAYPEGELGDVVDAEGSFIVFKVRQRIPAGIPPLDEVRSRVVSDLRQLKALEQAQRRAEELASLGLTELEAFGPESTGAFKRQAWYIPRLGMLPQIKEDLDALDTPKTYTAQDSVYVVWLSQRTAADIAGLDESALKRLRDEVLSAKRQEYFASFIQDLRSRHKIVIDRDKLL